MDQDEPSNEGTAQRPPRRWRWRWRWRWRAARSPRLCTAIVDRPTFNGTIIETGTDSYRLAQTRAKAATT
ncbi:ATP-binding protein [Streptomyces phaeochromogenes]